MINISKELMEILKHIRNLKTGVLIEVDKEIVSDLTTVCTILGIEIFVERGLTKDGKVIIKDSGEGEW